MGKSENKKKIEAIYEDMVKNRIPFGGVFELTPRCSLDCKMCFVHLTNEQMVGRKELTTEEWLRIMDAAYEMGMTYVLLTGGECMMHPGFKEIVIHLRAKGVFVTVNTNGLSVTDEMIEFLKKQTIRRVQVTIYGSNDDSYEKVTGHRVYQRVISAIEKLSAAGIAVQIAITPSAYLMEDLVDICRLCKSNNWVYSINNHLIDADEDTGRSLGVYQADEERLIKAFQQQIILEGGEVIPEDIETLEKPEIQPLEEPVRGLRCSAGRGSFAVTWDGKMHPCLNLRNVYVEPLKIGFQQAWKEVIESARNYIIPVECLSCKYAWICFTCVVNRSDPNNPGHCDPNICAVTMNRVAAGVKRIPSKEDLPF